jgi:SAM-dependent methyltransferase
MFPEQGLGNFGALRATPYYAEGSLSAAFYDVVTAADARLAGDEDIYASLAPEGGQILELGCGTGRLTAGLAARGFHVTGVDIAPAMLAKARARAAALPADGQSRVTLMRGDMTALNLKAVFDLVTCPFFTLAHVPAGAAWANTFGVAVRHLAPDGLVAVHLPRLEIMRLPGPPRSELPVMDQPLPDGRRLQLFVRERAFRERIGRLDQVLEYALTDPAGQILARSPERLTYYMTNPEPAAAMAGLVLDREPIAHGGVGDVWVFRRSTPPASRG